MAIRIEEHFCRYENAGSAVTALCGAEIRKGVLQGMKPSIFAKPFNGQNLPARALEGQNETGENRFAIQQNSASAAFAQFATVLRADMAEILAQDFQESLVGREGDVRLFPIQRETDLRRLLRFERERSQFALPFQ